MVTSAKKPFTTELFDEAVHVHVHQLILTGRLHNELDGFCHLTGINQFLIDKYDDDK